MNFKESPFLDIGSISHDARLEENDTGIKYIHSNHLLGIITPKITERLKYWAEKTPEHIFIAKRDEKGDWNKLTYKDAWSKAQTIGQYLLKTNANAESPVCILSGNSIEFAIVALAAMHVGIPFSPISPAYSTKSKDFGKLKHCINLLTPGLLFVQDAQEYKSALNAVANDIKVLTVANAESHHDTFLEALKTEVTENVEKAHQNITPQTVAKILFTSGSTGMPKGVKNTHGNITTNWQQTTQSLPMMENGGIRLIDWLPWHHTFGGNNNFGMTLCNGGSLYIDEGKPTPNGIHETLRNLREIAPTIYYNVPKGFEILIPYLRADKELCKFFFSELKMFFYAGASMSQKVWDDLEQLAYDTIGKRIYIGTGLGMTEASPSAMFYTRLGGVPGLLGVPVPGLTVKLVPDGDKMEARFKGDNLTPGYWRNEEATKKAFDEEGFYKTGDALKFRDKEDINKGMLFNGRISEDFKLDTGTWVSVGVLRSKIIAESKGLIQDAVITGHDQSYLGAIIFLEPFASRSLANLDENTSIDQVAQNEIITQAIQNCINSLGNKNTGSSTLIRKVAIADFDLSMEKGEITDKGSINQRAILKHRSNIVAMLHDKNKHANTILEYSSKMKEV